MSTAELTPAIDLSVVAELTDYTVLVKLDDQGNVIEEGKEKMVFKSSPAQIKAVEEAGFAAVKTQTYKSYKVKSWASFLELMNGDEDEAIAILMRGINQKTQQKIKDHLTDFDTEKQVFINAPTEDVIDTRDFLQAETQRRNLSTTERLLKQVSKTDLSTSDLAALIATLQAQMDAQSGE
jgi:hypothetical protein